MSMEITPTITELDERYSTTVQEYVEIIRDLVEEGKVARVRDIAEKRKVSRSSVSTAVNNLKDLGLVDHETYGYVTLTDEGWHLGRVLSLRQEILHNFFCQTLGLPEDIAHDEACKLEHTMSPAALNALIKFSTEQNLKVE